MNRFKIGLHFIALGFAIWFGLINKKELEEMPIIK